MEVQRFIQPTLVERMTTSPVVIVEGARAVGKTWLLRELRKSNHIRASFTLTEPTQLAAASENPLSWLRSLPTPFAIDEAQLLPELPMALKTLLDETGESIQCVLTGSAAIGRTGLGGTDPLARRSSRLTLEPLSEAELAAPQIGVWSVIDQLFHGTPDPAATDPLPADWESRIILGGLPRYRVMNAERSFSTLQRQIDQDVHSLLTDDVLPGERNDARIAHDVLTHLLMHPGGELNIAAISRAVSIDTRTVNRYVDILEQRFLVHEIPNFHRPTKKSTRSTAKCYPADSALSAAALLATDRTMTEAATRGGLMETHVTQQIMAHLGWAETVCTLTHWRENKSGRTNEVDLVLQDDQGRLVAIEIKAASAVSSSHFKGIRAFKTYYGERFHRGYVISTGDHAVSFGEDMWAIPLASLSNLGLWQESPAPEHKSARAIAELESAPQKELILPTVEDAQLFISYNHKDQNSSIGGDIRQFADDVVDALDGLYGRTVSIFLDENDLKWGDDLWARLDQELQTSTFLMPFITPRYLKSDACRQEFTTFSEAAQRYGSEQLLLPLIWIKPPVFDSDTTDPIVKRVQSTFYLDVTEARRADRSSSTYGNLVESAAKRLEEVIQLREANTPIAQAKRIDPENGGEPEPGLDELMDNAVNLLPEAETAVEEFLEDFTQLGYAFKDQSVSFQAKTPSQLRAYMVLVGNVLKEPNQRLGKSSRRVTQVWDELMTNLNRGFGLYSEIGGETVPEDLIASLQSLADQLEMLDTAEIEGIAHQMPKMSSKLVPTSRTLLSSVETIRAMERSVRSWLSAIEEE